MRNATCRVTGSGFIVDDDLVVTNAHVVAGGSTPQVVERGRPREATVVAFEPRSDLAVLRVNGLDGEPLILDLEAVRGSGGVVLGFPRNRSLTATDARLLEVSPVAVSLFDQRVRVDAYVLRTAVRPGNSGGPFVLDDGEVAGVVTRGGGRVGLAIASSELSPILEGLSPGPPPVAVGSC